MKKTYIIPEMTATKVALTQMLAGSPGGVTTTGDANTGSGNPFDYEGGDGDDAAVKSANYSVWEYNWDE